MTEPGAPGRPQASAEHNAALELAGVVKRFGAVAALEGAELSARAGEVHALLGENGAGKTTLMRVAFGLERPNTGTVSIGGAAVALRSPADAMRLGVGMVQQHFSLVPAMTVAENVALAHPEAGGGGGRWRFDARAAAGWVREASRRIGLPLDPGARAGDLPLAAQQRLEIVKALAADPRGAGGGTARVLILDEPTAVLAPAEATELMAMLRRLADDGCAVVLITHKLREALAIADRVTVLRHGRTVLAVPRADAREDELARAMFRRADDGEPTFAPATPARATGARGALVAEAREVSVADERGVLTVRGASLRVHAGEIVGVAGVEGSGHRELLRALAGRARPVAGTLALPPSGRVGFVPEDRLREAILPDAPLSENVALRGAGATRGRMPWASLVERTRSLIARHDVRAPGPRAPARGLSGGNQQKLVLARELDDAPLLIVAENPTRGLDMAASAAVRDRLLSARDAGAGVVLYSSDLDEVLGLADRILVVFAGAVREVGVDRDAVGAAMLGV